MTDVRPTEEQCQATIVEAARTLGYLVHHTRPANTKKGWRTPIIGDPGFVDLVICGHGRLFLIELKRKPNKPSADQLRWIKALKSVQADSGYTVGGYTVEVDVCYVPEQMGALIDDLARASQRGRAS